MKELFCAKCHRGANSFVVCPLCDNQDICMDHCPTCEHFAGTLEWQCRYREPTQILPNTKAAKVVSKFRLRMSDIEKRIAKKEGNPRP